MQSKINDSGSSGLLADENLFLPVIERPSKMPDKNGGSPYDAGLSTPNFLSPPHALGDKPKEDETFSNTTSKNK